MAKAKNTAKTREKSAKIGRPSLYSPELAAEICSRLAAGESLRLICLDDSMPDRETVRRWLLDDKEFRGQYARARDDHADDQFDRMSTLDSLVLSGDLNPAAHNTVINSMKWRLAKMCPKKYGDKAHLEVTGQDGGPLTIRWAKPGEADNDG